MRLLRICDGKRIDVNFYNWVESGPGFNLPSVLFWFINEPSGGKIKTAHQGSRRLFMRKPAVFGSIHDGGIMGLLILPPKGVAEPRIND